MANITQEHLHHMARRHHATMKQLDGLREKFAGYTKRGFATFETGAGAWLGGAFEGRTGGKALGPIPLNLGAGLLLVAFGHMHSGMERTVKSEVTASGSSTTVQYNRLGDHAMNLGNGLIGSYLAATGYAFGKRWKETGKVFGGGGRPWTHPYENGWPKGASAMPMPPGSVPGVQGWYEMYGG